MRNVTRETSCEMWTVPGWSGSPSPFSWVRQQPGWWQQSRLSRPASLDACSGFHAGIDSWGKTLIDLLWPSLPPRRAKGFLNLKMEQIVCRAVKCKSSLCSSPKKDTMSLKSRWGNLFFSWAARRSELVPITLHTHRHYEVMHTINTSGKTHKGGWSIWPYLFSGRVSRVWPLCFGWRTTASWGLSLLKATGGRGQWASTAGPMLTTLWLCKNKRSCFQTRGDLHTAPLSAPETWWFMMCSVSNTKTLCFPTKQWNISLNSLSIFMLAYCLASCSPLFADALLRFCPAP